MSLLLTSGMALIMALQMSLFTVTTVAYAVPLPYVAVDFMTSREYYVQHKDFASLGGFLVPMVCGLWILLRQDKKGGNMTSIFDVARYILTKTGPIGVWKLQKLCYYAEAWSLVWTDESLFPEDFEAWSNGPVCRPLADFLQKKFVVNETYIEKGEIERLSDDQKDTIYRVAREYGKMEPFELRDIARSENPWKDARGDILDGVECHAVIPKDTIKSYFGGL